MKRLLPAVLICCTAWLFLPSLGIAQSNQEGIRVFNEALKLHKAAQSHADLKRAVEKYEQALKIFQKLGYKAGIAKVANNLGIIYKNWGQYGKAVQYYEKSLATSRELKDKKGEERTFYNLGIVYKNWGQYGKAVQYYEKSLAMCRELKDKKSEGNTLILLGEVFREQAQYDKAVQYYEKSLATFRELKDKKRESYSMNGLGIVFWNWGQAGKAVAYFEKSLATFRELKDKKGEERTLNNLGIVYKNWGQYGKAVQYYEKSLAMCLELKDKKSEGNTLINLGNVYRNWGQYDKAVEYYEKSLATFRELKDKKGEGGALTGLANVFFYRGQHDKAIQYYEKALAIDRELKLRNEEGRDLNCLGLVYAHRGEHTKALTSFENGRRIWKEIKVPTGWPTFNIGMLYLDMGETEKAVRPLVESNYQQGLARLYLMKLDYQKAKEFYDKLLARAEKNRNADDVFTAYTGLGCAYEGLGENSKAEDYFGKAVAFTEELRSSLSKAERETFFDVKIYGFYRTAPYEGLARVLSKMQKPVEAFKASEYTKARVFAEAMSRLSGGGAFDVPTAVLKKNEQIDDMLAALKKSRQEAYEKGNKLVIESLKPQIADLEKTRQAHINMLRREYPLFAATKYPEPMDLPQSALGDDEWVLSYDVTDPGLIVYLTKGKKLIRALFKQTPRKDLDELVRAFRESMEIRPGKDTFLNKLKSFDFSSGKKLSDILLGEILEYLAKDTPVIIVPDDALGVLPFEMLVLNEGGKVESQGTIPRVTGTEFFGDRNQISYRQSVTALTLARNLAKKGKRADKMLVMADPVFEMKDGRVRNKVGTKKLTSAEARMYADLMVAMEDGKTGHMAVARLPLTGDLASNLKRMYGNSASVFTGLQAGKQRFLNEVAPGLRQYRDLVFATHGYFGKDLPGIQEPMLVLTLVPPGTDGFLRMSEVMGLKLNAEVVALTACQSGLGKRISGEGTMGMGRAFQYAGSKSVLMSLWSVAEKSSVMLVESFFKHVKEGKSKLDALRLARAEIRKSGYDHPFFWAPFILVGEVD